MLGIRSSDVYNSIFNMTEEKNKFKLYAEPLYNELSYITLKDKVAEILSVSDISPEDLDYEIHGPNIIKTYGKLSTEKSQTDAYYILSNIYLQTPIRDFESYLRILIGLNEDDIQLLIK